MHIFSLCMRKRCTPGGQDDDFCSCWGDTDLHSGVAILGQLSGQKLVQLGFEDAIWHKLREKDDAEFYMNSNILLAMLNVNQKYKAELTLYAE